ncbi:MAG: hypothetical protein WBM61_04170 [Woeseiaceae bacterium]
MRARADSVHFSQEQANALAFSKWQESAIEITDSCRGYRVVSFD